MSFDYGYTCGAIDNALDGLKEEIVEDLRSFYDDIYNKIVEQTLDKDELEDLVSYYSDRIFGYSSDACEDVRKENQDMRTEAENQIEAKIDEIDELKEELASRDANIDRLESEVDSLEDENADLKEDVDRLEVELDKFAEL